jgi:hypothetical protein
MNPRTIFIVFLTIMAWGTTHAADPCENVPPRNPINQTKQTSGSLVIGDTPGETLVIPAGTQWLHNGTIRIIKDGVLLIDGGELHLQGNDTHIFVTGNGRLTFRNGAYFHYEQDYVAQHILYGYGNARILFSDATVDSNGSTESIRMFGGARYTALNTHFADWTTWYMHDLTALNLINVCKAGDVVFDGAPTMYVENTTYFMPWLYFGTGADVDLSFPVVGNDDPVTMTINRFQPGMSGIPWSIKVVNSTRVWWGVDPAPGSRVTVRDSQLKMGLMRFSDSGRVDADELYRNRSSYTDQVFPLPDRYLRMINTGVEWWKVDAEGDVELHADNMVISEMMNKDSSRTWVRNTVCECQTIHVGVQDQAFLYYQDGWIWSYVSAWNQSTLVLDKTLVGKQDNPYQYQTRNIAHQGARLYAINSILLSPPEAVDWAVVMVAGLLPLEAPSAGEQIPIQGNAWSESGPLSLASFGFYALEYKAKGAASWTLIHSSTTPKKYPELELGIWDTRTLPAGEYTLRLTVFNWLDDPNTTHPTYAYPAIVDVVLN